MNRYAKLEKEIGVTLKNRALLDAAFVHKSYMNEAKDKEMHNERLEFLGDAVLELVVTELLYESYPNPEGELTNFRSAIVRGEHLAAIARKLQLGSYLFLSKGEEKGGGREKNYILANTIEALIGAIYLDQGYEKAKIFIQKHILAYLGDILKKGLHIDSKSAFQEIAQARLEQTPEYRVLEESGPDHDKRFTVGAYLADELVGEGSGTSKQAAEQQAAEDALRKKGWRK